MSTLERLIVLVITMTGLFVSAALIFLGTEYHFGTGFGLPGWFTYPTAALYLAFTYRSMLHFLDHL